jgi:AraC-like DNA-binding protein
MVYKECKPSAQLTEMVRSYWWLDNASDQQLDFTILPDGCFDLIVSFDNYRQGEVSLTGIWSQQVEVSIQPNQQLFGIRFTLLAADYLLQQKISDCYNSEEIKPYDFWQVNELPFPVFEAVVAKMNDYMVSILEKSKAMDTRKQQLFRLLQQTHGAETVEYYASQVFWSQRQINRYFKDRFGLPLKSYAKILKLFASYQSIKEGRLYPDGNYFDQSHFIKDLKKHTGNNPTDLFENKNDRFLQLTALPKK